METGVILNFYKIDGKKNPADILSKHCGFPQAWPLIKPLLFWGGDTSLISDDGEHVQEDNAHVKAVWWNLHKMIQARTIGEY